MAAQIFSGLALLVILFLGWKLYQRDQYHQAIRKEQERIEREAQEEKRIAARAQQLELEAKQAYVDFHRMRTHGLHAAIAYGMSFEASNDGHIKASWPPQQPRTQVTEVAQEQRQIAAPPLAQPSLSTIVEELPYNELAFTFGLDQETAQLVPTTLPKAVHIQLIGSTGQGKSYQSTSILTQLCAGNDADHLQLALIDCEGQTTEPFQNLSHVRHFADDPEQAARVLHHLVRELNRRDQVRVIMPAILIFVEEFLNLRRIMPANIKDQALEDYTTLALRGKKRGMFLFSVGQTAYVEKAIRDAQNQFQSSMAFAGKPSMARAAGFTNTDLLNQLWRQRQPGQFLLERPSGDSLLLAPFVNPVMVPKLLTVGNSQVVPDHFPGGSQVVPDYPELNNGNHAGKQPELDRDIMRIVREMVGDHKSQNEIVTAAFPGMRNADAVAEYRRYLAAALARKEHS